MWKEARRKITLTVKKNVLLETMQEMERNRVLTEKIKTR